jgi:hypothetical protein
MAKKLTTAEANLSRAFLHDLFEAGGLLKYPVRTDGHNYIKEYYASDAATICNEIKYRTFDFSKADKAIRNLSGCWVDPLKEPGKTKRPDASSISNIIAAFCSENEIFWDDVNVPRTKTEMEAFRANTFGAACWEFECFLSQRPAKSATATPATRGAKRSKAASGGSAPKSGYKTSGAKSGLIKGLIGKPGEKITFDSGRYLYSIICASSKPKKQFAFIDPVNRVADPNIVRLGDPSGFSACKLFFKSIDEANAAIEQILLKIDVPSHISGFTPARCSPEANGYFLVNTEIGQAYIKAQKLNETIAEELDTPEETPARKAKFPEINDIDVYNEAFFRE